MSSRDECTYPGVANEDRTKIAPVAYATTLELLTPSFGQA
jgi:hypothetical protein